MENLLGKRLRKVREKEGLSQKRAAKIFGLTNYQLSRYETGQSNPAPDLISKFANYYDITSDYLLGLSDEPSLTETQYREALEEYEELIKELEPLLPEERKRRIQRLRDFAKGMSESD